MVEVDVWQRLGLKNPPFDPGRCMPPPFGGGPFGRAEADLRGAIDRRPPLILVTGDSGVGRTTLVEKLAEDSELAPGTVLVEAGGAGDFPNVLRQLLQRLDPANGDVETPQLGRQLMMTLRQAQLPKGAALLILDDADKVDQGLLTEALRLSAVAAARQPLVCLLLVGERDFQRRLDDRLAALMLFHRLYQVSLKPLSAEETGEYVTQRLEVAGHAGPPLFSDDAIRVIARLSHGLPGTINRICRATLQYAGASDRPIGGREVSAVFSSLDEYDTAALKASREAIFVSPPVVAATGLEDVPAGKPIASKSEASDVRDVTEAGEAEEDTSRIEQVAERVGEALNRSATSEPIRLSPLPEPLSEDEIMPDSLPVTVSVRQPTAVPASPATEFAPTSEFPVPPAPEPEGLQDGLVVKALTSEEHVAPRRRVGRGLLVSALSLTVVGAIIGGWWMWRSAPEIEARVAAGRTSVPADRAAQTEVAVRETPATPAAEPPVAPDSRPAVITPEVAAPPPPPPPADLATANGGNFGAPVPLGGSGPAVEATVPVGAMAVAAQDSAPAPAAAAEEPKSPVAAESGAEKPPVAASPPVVEPPTPTTPPPPMPVPAAEAPPAAPVKPALPASPPSPAPAAVPAIDVSALLARGDAFLANADVASAQLFYKRAAAEGSGAGALAMAGTLDPVILRERRVPGARPQPAEAIVWYRQSIELGEPRAQVRLDRLLAELRIAAAGGDQKARAILESQR